MMLAHLEEPPFPHDVSAQEMQDYLHFEEIAAEALACIRASETTSVPSKIANVSWVIGSLPSHDLMVHHGFRPRVVEQDTVGHDERTITGLYVPAPPAPSPIIVLFWKALVSAAWARDLHLRDLVRDTLMHEIGHHLGLGHAQLRELGI